jgi:divalent metal cation (Fe/Co/Zn/Cd) transporter
LWLSIATIALKTAAWLLTGSIGLFADTAESIRLAASGDAPWSSVALAPTRRVG